MDRKPFIFGIILVIIIIGAVFFVLSQQKPFYPEIANPVPVKGNLQASVVVEEFSDYQCPACIAAEPFVEQVFQQFKDKAKFEYKQFPLISIHQFAEKASEASLCAQDLNNFWGYHDLLFKAEGNLAQDQLVAMAKTAGINEMQFKTCLDSGVKQAHVQQFLNDGIAKGVNATPSFFVNGEKVEGNTLSEILGNLSSLISKKIGGN